MSNTGSGRRQMLGTLNLNEPRKLPLGHKRASLAERSTRPSLGSRLSLASTRRLSLFGAGGRLSVIPTDTRPIGNKSFHQENIRALIKFLTLQNYDREISSKTLFTPSRNDFIYISAFLFRKIYPNFNLDYNGQTWIDDFPLLFDFLGYPQKISKRSLLSVGSPHTWPALLAALVWLVDLATSVEAHEAQQATQQSTDKDFFNYLLGAYAQFLDGSDNVSFTESSFASQMDERNEVTREYITRTECQLKEIRRENIALQKSQSFLADAQERRQNLSNDVCKLQAHINELREFNKGLTKEQAELEQQVASGTSKLQAVETEVANLREQLHKQKQSAVDIGRIQAEKELRQQTLAKFQNESEQIKSRCSQTEMSITIATDALNRLAQLYNQTTLRASLQPLNNCKYGHGIDYELKINMAGKAAEDILGGTDMKRVVKPALHKLKQSFNKTLRKMAVDKRRAQETLTMRSDTKGEKLEELQMLQARATKLDTSYREHREQKNAELRDRLTKVEDSELAMQKLKYSEDRALAESEEAVKKARVLLQETKCKHEEEQEELKDLIKDTMNSLAEHKVYVSKTIHNLDDAVSSYEIAGECELVL